MAETTAYQRYLIESLKDPCEAAAYLNTAIVRRKPGNFSTGLA